MEHLENGQALVLRSVGASYSLLLPDGSQTTAWLRGKLRLEGYTTTNPIAVGDVVSIALDPSGQHTITGIRPRHNHILRKATKAGSQAQLLCANIDQAVFVATLRQPFTALGYIDRFLVMCQAYHIPVTVLFHKTDLYTPADREKLDYLQVVYRVAGYGTMTTSLKEPDLQARLTELLRDKVSFLAGLSGAGKSSLINVVDPSLNLRTATLAKHSNKGRHTTTFAEMHALAFGGWVIDAPGFSEFDLVGLEPAELGGYFPEFVPFLDKCRYASCLHLHEPGCAIQQAVENADLSDTRYHTYLNMLESVLHPDQKSSPRHPRR